jgi:hypothetical protein
VGSEEANGADNAEDPFDQAGLEARKETKIANPTEYNVENDLAVKVGRDLEPDQADERNKGCFSDHKKME